MNTAPLTLVANEPAADVVEMLEDALQAAKNGDIRSAMLVTADKGYRTSHAWAGMPYMVMATIGELRAAERDLMDDYVD